MVGGVWFADAGRLQLAKQRHVVCCRPGKGVSFMAGSTADVNSMWEGRWSAVRRIQDKAKQYSVLKVVSTQAPLHWLLEQLAAAVDLALGGSCCMTNSSQWMVLRII